MINVAPPIVQSEEVKMCIQEFSDLINSVAAYKEYMRSKIYRMRNDLLETAGAVADIYEEYRPLLFQIQAIDNKVSLNSNKKKM